VCLAKKAQLGVVLSRFADPEPTTVHPASLVRGRLHLELVSEAAAARVEALVASRLRALQVRHPELVGAPRGCGFAFAFDLPDSARLQAFLGQRFWRGAVVFAAGTRTARYRLSPAFGEAELGVLFEAIHRSLAFLEAHPGEPAPEWHHNPLPGRRAAAAPERRLRLPPPEEAEPLLDALLEIEARSYEPARRDTRDTLRLGFDPEGVAVVAEVRQGEAWVVAGSALATPLEQVAHVEGPDRDPSLGQGDTLYSLAVTVDPRWQGLGLGLALKQAQRREAAQRHRDDGSRRFRFVTGRNRIGSTGAMNRVNRRLGAFGMLRLGGQYGEAGGEAAYYRIPVGRFAPEPAPEMAQPLLDLASGIAAPVASAPGLERAEADGALYGPAVHKLTLCNYATPASVRASEWIAALVPDRPHLYLANSRDEALEKTLRLLRLSRPGARVAVGLEGAYLGHTTAAARSSSDPALHRQRGPAFGWPRIPHPALGVEASLAGLEQAAARAGGPERLFAVVIEAVQERTGRVVPEAFWAPLGTWLDAHDVPLVLAETASAAYRSGRGALLGAALPRRPDVLLWWAGGQVACVHVGARHYVAAPLALVSTWDGDELSLVRLHHQLRTARRLDLAAGVAALEAALAPLGPVLGLGLYRVVEAGERAAAIAAGLADCGVRVGELPGGRLAFAPPLDRAQSDAAALARALAEAGLA
jgi:4-aminobutyrate aminotransferase-like enzyme/GNAT superfamily N-acetyltransferase